ncbi:glycoside hydrolase family 92 protein, partial [Xanthomonas perforans]|nr:glycoside hydrolase family 92 protein [Xanthomonas perforans]
MTLPVVLLHKRGLPRTIAIALFCLAALPAMAATHFASAFEDGDPSPMPVTDTAVQVAVGAGPAAPYAAKPNAGYSGAHALRYASNGAGGRRALFTTDLLIQTQTTLSWMVLPESVGNDHV